MVANFTFIIGTILSILLLEQISNFYYWDKFHMFYYWDHFEYFIIETNFEYFTCIIQKKTKFEFSVKNLLFSLIILVLFFILGLNGVFSPLFRWVSETDIFLSSLCASICRPALSFSLVKTPEFYMRNVKGRFSLSLYKMTEYSPL